MRLILFLAIAGCFSACGRTYYIVRHAEKAVPSAGITMSTPNDPPLSPAGEQRAQDLLQVLQHKKIRHIFSTNTIRTRTTAEPISQYTGVAIETYGPRPDSNFINRLKSLKHNTLIVGHSNTVDDLVNGFFSSPQVPGDLPDSVYNSLFVVKYRMFPGRKMRYERRVYGR